VSIRLLPIAAQQIGWQWVFACLAPGPFLGALAVKGLAPDKTAKNAKNAKESFSLRP